MKSVITFLVSIISIGSIDCQVSFGPSMVDIGEHGTLKSSVSSIPDADGKYKMNFIVKDVESTGPGIFDTDLKVVNINFEASLDEIEQIISWFKERHSKKSPGSITLGEHTITYDQHTLGASIYNIHGPDEGIQFGLRKAAFKKVLNMDKIESIISKK